MKTIKIGLIGAGKHGRRYARHIVEDIPQAELVAICRRDRVEGEQTAATYSCSYYPDYQHLLADDRVEALTVAVPPTLHGDIVEAAGQAGKHILLEKPFAVSVAEARRIRSLIAASQVRCMVAHTLRFNAVVQTLQAHLHEIAPLHTLYLSQRFEPSPLRWLDHKAESGGGIVLHTGVHSFDLLRFLGNSEVRQVWCQTTKVFTAETEDNFLMMCQMEDPILRGTVAGSRSTHSRSGLIEISGEKGQLFGDHTHGFAYLVKGPERIPLRVGPTIPTVRETVRAFVYGLQHRTPFPIDMEDGLQAVAVAEACYRSAVTGQPAQVEQVEQVEQGEWEEKKEIGE